MYAPHSARPMATAKPEGVGCPGLDGLARGRRAAIAPSGERGDDQPRDAAEQRERNEPHRRGDEQDTQGEPEHIEPERGQRAEQPDVLPEKPMHAGSTRIEPRPGDVREHRRVDDPEALPTIGAVKSLGTYRPRGFVLSAQIR